MIRTVAENAKRLRRSYCAHAFICVLFFFICVCLASIDLNLRCLLASLLIWLYSCYLAECWYGFLSVLSAALSSISFIFLCFVLTIFALMFCCCCRRSALFNYNINLCVVVHDLYSIMFWVYRTELIRQRDVVALECWFSVLLTAWESCGLAFCCFGCSLLL